MYMGIHVDIWGYMGYMWIHVDTCGYHECVCIVHTYGHVDRWICVYIWVCRSCIHGLHGVMCMSTNVYIWTHMGMHAYGHICLWSHI